MKPTTPTPATELDLPISSLFGRKVRLVRIGEVMTQDIQPGRVTLFLGPDNTIAQIKIEAQTLASE